MRRAVGGTVAEGAGGQGGAETAEVQGAAARGCEPS
eukprot:CAMPEP_0175287540 /NCGR_PEP_ID=MMETSP0093-20121207/54338_1 /TAXON_ID=311494 /ORGANISM="Alexandrium monilatum, Strain CCMP3105" /LENGTH=35 /DNA_ID= /DNA_START= /DNA_END= /DNA_ORIENTATION=